MWALHNQRSQGVDRYIAELEDVGTKSSLSKASDNAIDGLSGLAEHLKPAPESIDSIVERKAAIELGSSALLINLVGTDNIASCAEDAHNAACFTSVSNCGLEIALSLSDKEEGGSKLRSGNVCNDCTRYGKESKE